MSTGTIALTNNSKNVVGTGTSFTSDLKVGDFAYVTVGGAPYTLVVASITSNTQLTLSVAFDGPTTTGLAWNAVPASIQIAITQKILNDFASVARGRILDFQNWQKIYSDAASVTVTRPDRTSFTGPSWGYLANHFSDALTKDDNLASVTNKQTAWNNIAQYGSTSTTAARGDDSRLNTVGGKTGGTISSSVQVTAGTLGCNGPIVATGGNFFCDNVTDTTADATATFMRAYALDRNYDVYHQYYLVKGQYHSWRSIQNGIISLSVRSNGSCYAVSFNPTSDSRLKFNKKFIGDALSKSMTLRGMTYQIQGEEKAGVIAQDAQKILPESVTVGGEEIVLEDGEIINDQLSLDYAGITALNTEALKDVVKLMLECLNDPDSAKAKLTELVGAINASTDDANKTDMRMEWALVNQPETQPEIEPPVTDSTDADS